MVVFKVAFYFQNLEKWFCQKEPHQMTTKSVIIISSFQKEKKSKASVERSSFYVLSTNWNEISYI